MDHALAVQIEFPDRGAACRSQANEIEVIGTPGEMLAPVVMTWMKERNCAARCRVEGMRLVGFGAVATLTGQGQVVFIVGATPAFRLDMLEGMQLCSAEFGADAVFAIAMRALSDQAAQLGGEALLSHVARA